MKHDNAVSTGLNWKQRIHCARRTGIARDNSAF